MDAEKWVKLPKISYLMIGKGADRFWFHGQNSVWAGLLSQTKCYFPSIIAWGMGGFLDRVLEKPLDPGSSPGGDLNKLI